MSEEKNPWNDKNSNNNDFFGDFVKKSLKKITEGDSKKEETPKQPSIKGILLLVLSVFILYGLYQAAYQIQPGQRGIVLRLGSYDRTTMPGLNFMIPYIESLYKIDVEKVKKEQFGITSGNSNVSRRYLSGSQNNNQDSISESLMLTGDKNVIYLNWVVQYRISDPVQYLFKLRRPNNTVRDVSETVIRRLVGNRAFDYILDGREELAFEAKKEMQAIFNSYGVGIQLETVQLLDVNPPNAVRDAFNEVNEADQTRRKLKNEAQKVYNERVTQATGTARQIVEEARGYKVQRVNKALGETARFNSLYKEYRTAKQVTRDRMYLEVMKEVLPNVQNLYIIDEDVKSMVPLLNLKGQGSGQVFDRNITTNGGKL